MPRPTPEIPNASMADIAFLLLVFFLVTTTVANIKGLSVALPPPPEALPPEDVKIQERNLFKIQVNSFDNLLVEGEPWTKTNNELTEDIKKFILNNGADPNSSDNPEKAIVSYKTDRGTTHKKFVEILDAIQKAYYDIYADQAGVTNEKWREIASDPKKTPEYEQLYEKGRAGIPMAISIAEPTKVGG
ncbi:MAG TPA: biopolymer transporter ExbD [Cyclobacteriaceae bacterium]|nr:biopolymer transporter ExbD [Cyclobacteriaceae bacterium]